jgi:hypothetical protein
MSHQPKGFKEPAALDGWDPNVASGSITTPTVFLRVDARRNVDRRIKLDFL